MLRKSLCLGIVTGKLVNDIVKKAVQEHEERLLKIKKECYQTYSEGHGGWEPYGWQRELKKFYKEVLFPQMPEYEELFPRSVYDRGFEGEIVAQIEERFAKEHGRKHLDDLVCAAYILAGRPTSDGGFPTDEFADRLGPYP
jgi:hypothetical protein